MGHVEGGSFLSLVKAALNHQDHSSLKLWWIFRSFLSLFRNRKSDSNLWLNSGKHNFCPRIHYFLFVTCEIIYSLKERGGKSKCTSSKNCNNFLYIEMQMFLLQHYGGIL